MVLTATVHAVMSYCRTRVANLHFSLGDKVRPNDDPADIEAPHTVFPLWRAMDKVLGFRNFTPRSEISATLFKMWRQINSKISLSYLTRLKFQRNFVEFHNQI